MWVELFVGSLPCSERFFFGYSGFPLSSKTNILKFQVDQESDKRPLCGCASYKSLLLQQVLYRPIHGFLRPKREISTIYFLMFLELSVIQYRILNPLRCGKMPTSALLCLLLISRDSLLLWFAVLSRFSTVEIVFETAMKVWGKHLRPLTPTGTDTSQDMSFRKCYLTSTIFWMMYSSIYSWTGQYWSLLRLLLFS